MAKKKPRKAIKQTEVLFHDQIETDTPDKADLAYQWLDPTLKHRDRSRLLRRMKACRELERRRDQALLRALIDDVWFLEQAP
jgi:hypothetical protein